MTSPGITGISYPVGKANEVNKVPFVLPTNETKIFSIFNAMMYMLITQFFRFQTGLVMNDIRMIGGMKPLCQVMVDRWIGQ